MTRSGTRQVRQRYPRETPEQRHVECQRNAEGPEEDGRRTSGLPWGRVPTYLSASRWHVTGAEEEKKILERKVFRAIGRPKDPPPSRGAKPKSAHDPHSLRWIGLPAAAEASRGYGCLADRRRQPSSVSLLAPGQPKVSRDRAGFLRQRVGPPRGLRGSPAGAEADPPRQDSGLPIYHRGHAMGAGRGRAEAHPAVLTSCILLSRPTRPVPVSRARNPL